MDPIKRSMTRWIYRLVLESPKAHILLLQLYLGAEAFHNRFAWFRRPELVDDPELQLLMRQHFADEDNHAKYFRLALTLKGDPVNRPPLELDYLVQLAAAFWEEGILVGDTVEELTGDRLFTNPQNLFVQLAFKDLSEKRAIGEFHLWRDLARTRDPETYTILKRVVEDEDWHVHIFHDQVHKRLGDPTEGARYRGLYRRLIATSRRIQNRTSANFVRFLLDHDLIVVTPLQRLALRAISTLQGLGTGTLPMERAKQLMALETSIFDEPTEAIA
ncbi:MAG TPA: hypothetical protein V6D47_02880 [Oscillatoriaceae cyanobacterium]